MNSKNAYELFSMGKKLASANEHLRAAMLLEKASMLEPEKGSIHEALATSYFNCGFYQAAKKHFIRALDINAANDFAHYGLGLCLAKEGRFEPALGSLKIALAMKPDDPSYDKTVKKYGMLLKNLRK